MLALSMEVDLTPGRSCRRSGRGTWCADSRRNHSRASPSGLPPPNGHNQNSGLQIMARIVQEKTLIIEVYS